MGLFRRKKKDDELGYEPLGEYVTKKRVDRLKDLLGDDEQVMYLIKGNYAEIVRPKTGFSLFGNRREQKFGFRKGILTAITNERILIHVPQITGDDERTIPYRTITAVGLDPGLVERRLTLQTPGQTFHIRIGSNTPNTQECRELVQYIQKKVDEVQHQDSQQEPLQESQPPTDPMEQLKQLKELYDLGAVNEDEYDEKKQKLLERI